MNRSLKTMGLALAAMLALSAVAASAASAAPKLTPVPEEYPVTVEAQQSTTIVLGLEGGRKLECTTATFEGEIKNKAEAEESKQTLKPKLEHCTMTILGNVDLATVTHNGCDFLFTNTEATSGTIAAEGWKYTGKEIHIQCPAGASIEVHGFTSEANDLSNTPLCTMKIGAQTPGGDVDYKLLETNAEGAGTSTEVKMTLTGVTVTRVSGTPTNCGGATQNASIGGSLEANLFNSGHVMQRGKFDPS